VVTFTVNGTSVTAPLIYSLASQVAGVLPSNTPLGTGTSALAMAGYLELKSLSFRERRWIRPSDLTATAR
jgi:hypothetical protein